MTLLLIKRQKYHRVLNESKACFDVSSIKKIDDQNTACECSKRWKGEGEGNEEKRHDQTCPTSRRVLDVSRWNAVLFFVVVHPPSGFSRLCRPAKRVTFSARGKFDNKNHRNLSIFDNRDEWFRRNGSYLAKITGNSRVIAAACALLAVSLSPSFSMICKFNRRCLKYESLYAKF